MKGFHALTASDGRGWGAMSELAAELSRGAVLREDTGEWVKDQARRLMRAIEPLCADVVRVSEGDRSGEATAWRTLLASVRGVLPELRENSTYGAIPIDSTRLESGSLRL